MLNRRGRSPKNPVHRLCAFYIVWIAGIASLANQRVSFSHEPIYRLPAIDATRNENRPPPYPRVGSRSNADPFPRTGSDLDIFGNDQRPGFPWPDSTNFGKPLPSGEQLVPSPPARLSPHKNGFFQKWSISATWLDGGSLNNLGITELESQLSVALPLPTKDHPLLISPSFETRFLKGPSTPDLPAQLFSAYTQFTWAPKITDQLRGILSIEPGLYGDFKDSDADNFRLLGKGMFYYKWIPDRFEILAGVLYLDRDDVKILPAGGVIWSPTDDIRFEIVFPRPKFAYRISWDGRVEHWIYLSGEFGGDSWAVQRANLQPDRLTLRDIRVMLGIERKLEGGAGARLEAGYVFGRTIEYSSATPDINLEDTIMLRGVLTF